MAKRPGWSILRRLHWRHNGFMGHARMMELHAEAIATSSTATEETAQIAGEILALSRRLSRSLKKRRDPRTGEER